MAPSVSSALGDLLQSLAAIGTSLLNSVFAVFQAILALIQELVGSLLQLAQTLFAFAANLLQGAVGFIVANFFAVALVGGGYYWYTHRDGSGRTRSGGKRVA